MLLRHIFCRPISMHMVALINMYLLKKGEKKERKKRKKRYRSEKQLLQIATVEIPARRYAILDILSGSLTAITRGDFISEDGDTLSVDNSHTVRQSVARLFVEIRSTRKTLTLVHCILIWIT